MANKEKGKDQLQKNTRDMKPATRVESNNLVGNSAGDNVTASRAENPEARSLSTSASVNSLLIFPRKSSKNTDATDLSLESAVNYPAMPFHHLIPAALLAFDSSFTQQGGSSYQPDGSTAGKPFFWQVLAACGVPPREAVLFDDSIECSFIELLGDHLIQVDWEALHYDALEGCAEIYLAEMFIFKRRLYEAGDDLQDSLEFTDDLAAYLPEEIFTPHLVESAVDLFFDSLITNFTVTVSRTADQPVKVPGRSAPSLFPDLFTSHITEGSRRAKGWSGIERIKDGIRTSVYTVSLGNYWHNWQRAARLSKFDFDLLNTLTNACSVRLYELTKLWRVPPSRLIDAEQETDTEPVKQTSVSPKLEIEYEKFAALMPLPVLKSAREVKEQIERLIKPLRKGGYIKQFVLKDDWRGNSVRSIRLVFRFKD